MEEISLHDAPKALDPFPNAHQHLPYWQLTPKQSCTLHGWWNPKRTLHWEDIRKSPGITVKLCAQCGISASVLKRLQPDVTAWIRDKHASFPDVSWMMEWPLHPIDDLRGNISDLAAMHYPAGVLRRLGITYEYMRSRLQMSDEWMRVMRYDIPEWVEIGFTVEHAKAMGPKRIHHVFETQYDSLLLHVASLEPLHQPYPANPPPAEAENMPKAWKQ